MSQGLATTATPVGAPYTPWVRPADWLALPAMVQGDQKVAMLWAVYQADPNYVAFTVSGNFTVDWGDGTAPVNYASGTTVNASLAWASYGAGTLTSRGYRQALITITPQSGANIQTVNLLVKHSAAGLPNGYSTGLLDVRMAAPLCNSITIGNGTSVVTHRMLELFEFVGTNVIASFAFSLRELFGLRRVAGTLWLGSCTNASAVFNSNSSLEIAPTFAGPTNQITDWSSAFGGCSAMRSVALFDTSGATSTGSMFSGCRSLQTVPAFNLSACTNTVQMFNGCSALRSIPAFNLSQVTDASLMFLSCPALGSVGALTLTACTTTASMFSGCYALSTISSITTSAALTNANNMFVNCYALQTVPSFNTSAVTNASSMFSGCLSLSSVPGFNLAACTNASSMFSGCTALPTVPAFNLPACTNASSMFASCSALRSIPAFTNTQNVTTWANVFLNCAALASVGAMDWSGGTNLGSAFSGCTSLSSVLVTGIKTSVSFASAFLGPAALDTIYTNLATVVGQTITVSSNYGTTSDTPTIATGKGWTVVGS